MRIVKVCACKLCGKQLAHRTRPASPPDLLQLRNDWVIVNNEVSHREFGLSQVRLGMQCSRVWFSKVLVKVEPPISVKLLLSLTYLHRGQSTHDKYEIVGNIFGGNVAGVSVVTLSGRGQAAVGAPGPGGAPRPVSLQLWLSITKWVWLFFYSFLCLPVLFLLCHPEHPSSCWGNQYAPSVPPTTSLSPWSTQTHRRGASRGPSAHPRHPPRSPKTCAQCPGQTDWPASR